MTTISCRDAVQGDVSAVVALFRASFSPEVVDATIFGARGIARWVAVHVAAAPDSASRLYFVADVEGEIVGGAEIVRESDGLFLNYIAVAPTARGSGVASALLRHALNASRQAAHGRLRLDVFSDNATGIDWYRRLGLTPTGQREWWRLPSPPVAPGGWIRVAGLPEAAACQRAYGFSEIVVETATRAHRVGQLGWRWFRLTDPSALSDEDLLGCLGGLDPRRSLLVLAPPDFGPSLASLNGRRFNVALRMEGSLDSALAGLG